MWLSQALLLFIFASYGIAERPQVKTSLGTICGHIKTSHDGRKFSAFEGIPFAKPPIGHLRFEEPEPIEPWLGCWDATYLTECPQNELFQLNVFEGDEDCLHINVYVPREVPNPKENLDVVVHIHGGGYMMGSGHWYSKPEFLMDKNLIFVTFNYRLGVLGFLSTEDNVVPGNNGMKDQVLALKWIQENIASFGGNPKSVTLTGTSAGASSVHLHYLSPLSKGLFQRGLSQSGTSTNCWSIQENALDKAKRLGEYFGCPLSTTRVLIECLKEKPFKHILDKTKLFSGQLSYQTMSFTPVVEKESARPFLSDYPYNLLKKGEVLDVPWMSSNTLHEGAPFANFVFKNFDEANQNWLSLAPLVLDFNYTLPTILHKTVSQKILNFYVGEDQQISKENQDKIIKMFSDRYFLVDSETAVKLHASGTKSPVYYYLFAYPGDLNDLKLVNHGDDTRYFFGCHIPKSRPLTENELKMKDVMLDMLVSYAKTGVPVIKGVDWKPTEGDKLTYLEIGGYDVKDIEVKITEKLFKTHAFWVSLGFLENENLGSGGKDEL